METTRSIMTRLICHLLPDAQQYETIESLNDDLLSKLYEMSAKQDLAHLVAASLEKKGLLPKNQIGKAFEKQKMLSILRREQQNYEEKRICDLLEEERIDYILLKGAVIKRFYPEEWMRTSCDIDILIKPEQTEKAIKALTERFGYIHDRAGNRDHSLIAKNRVNLELHYSLLSVDYRLNPLLLRAWEFAEAKEQGYEYAFTNEFFLYHTVAHAQYHFVEGGCGARCILDLWLLLRDLEYSEEKLFSLLDESGSRKFFLGLKELGKVWFEGLPHNESTLLLEEYILNGGMFGSRYNLGSTGMHKGGNNWFKYLWSRIYYPREKLEKVYYDLKEKPWLFPVYQVRRWFNIFKKENRMGVYEELKGRAKGDSTAKLMEYLGI